MNLFRHIRFLLLCAVWFASSCRINVDDDSRIFRYNETTGIASLDPAFARNQSVMWPVHQLYNTLVEVDETMSPRPSLARSWKISDDRLTIMFQLRADVYFHDDPCFPGGKGRLMRSADILFSLNRIIDPSTASPGAWIFHDRLDSLHPFNVIDDSTFEIRLRKPFQPILGILSMKYCSVVPREAVEAYGKDFGRHPVGTGPFRLVRWHEQEALIMSRNPRYFERDSLGRALPYLEGIRINFYDSKLTEFLEFRQGRLDFINDLDASVKDQLLTKTGRLKKGWEQTAALNTCPYLNIEYLGILTVTDTLNNPLSDIRVRKAIGYAIDRKKMLMYLRNSVGTAAEGGFVPPGLPSFTLHSETGFSYRPDLARQLLSSAGYGTRGRPMQVIKLLTVPNYASLGSYLVHELQDCGIPAEVEVVQKTVLLDKMATSGAPFFRGSWIADYPDAENYLSVFYSKNPAPPNYTRYNNPLFDRLYEQAVSEPSDSFRYVLYHRMDSMVMSDAPVIPLWYDQVLHLVRKEVSGMSPNSLNMLELRRVRKE